MLLTSGGDLWRRRRRHVTGARGQSQHDGRCQLDQIHPRAEGRGRAVR